MDYMVNKVIPPNKTTRSGRGWPMGAVIRDVDKKGLAELTGMSADVLFGRGYVSEARGAMSGADLLADVNRARNVERKEKLKKREPKPGSKGPELIEA